MVQENIWPMSPLSKDIILRGYCYSTQGIKLAGDTEILQTDYNEDFKDQKTKHNYVITLLYLISTRHPSRK